MGWREFAVEALLSSYVVNIFYAELIFSVFCIGAETRRMGAEGLRS